MTQSDAEVAEQLNKYFESTFTTTRITEKRSHILNYFLWMKIKLLSWYFTSSFPEITGSLFSQTFLFINKAIVESNSGTLPDFWKKANITPIII